MKTERAQEIVEALIESDAPTTGHKHARRAWIAGARSAVRELFIQGVFDRETTPAELLGFRTEMRDGKPYLVRPGPTITKEQARALCAAVHADACAGPFQDAFERAWNALVRRP